MPSSKRAARAAALFGALAVLAIPAGIAASRLLNGVTLLRSLYVSVAAACVLGLLAVACARRARFARCEERQAGRRVIGAARAGRLRGPGSTSGSRARSRWRSTASCAGRSSRRAGSRLPFVVPCSRSATASVRHACAEGIDFAQAELATKVRGKYLRALEEEQFDVLPAQTYVKGFLRTYAEYLGLDGQLYVDEYNSRFVGAADDHEPRARRSAARPQRRHRRIETNVVLSRSPRSRC